jgi:serine/threonine-protein kinase HipA
VTSEASTSLEVWLLNQRAGTLWLKDWELQFQYGTLWLEQAQAIALSQSLPLQAEPFGDRA